MLTIEETFPVEFTQKIRMTWSILANSAQSRPWRCCHVAGRRQYIRACTVVP